jgi:hypothetical protein
MVAPSVSFVIPERVEDANYDVQLHIGESRFDNFRIPGSMLCIAPE